VTLRSIHEVFESDRRALIKTISLELGTETVDPATGRPTSVSFVVVGAAREAFLKLNLSAVVPALTLDRLGAAVSRNPYGLLAVEASGVRRS
jgi:restriction system protein